MPALTYQEAMFIGLLPGIAELFPVSSLGHRMLIPAIIGGGDMPDFGMTRHRDFPSSGGSPGQSPRSTVSAGGQARARGYRLSAVAPRGDRDRR